MQKHCDARKCAIDCRANSDFIGWGWDDEEDVVLVVLERDSLRQGGQRSKAKPAPRTWRLRTTFLFVVISSLALWAGVIALVQAVF